MNIPRFFATVLTLAAGLSVACAQPATPAAPSQPAAPAGADQAKAPVTPKVNRLVMSMPVPAIETNAVRDLGPTTVWELRPMYEYLLHINSDTGKLEPGLATEWNVEPEGKYRMKLRKDVPLHGDAGAFGAQDVVFTWKDVTDPKSLYPDAPVFRGMITEINPVSDNEVVFTVPENSAFFTYWVSQGQGGFEIRSAKQGAAGQPTMQGKPLAGTGPYQFKERAQGQYVRYEKTAAKQWRQTPDFPEFEFRFQGEASTRLASLLAGEVHVTTLPQDLQKSAEGRGMKVAKGKVAGPRIFFGIDCCFLKDTQKLEGWLYPDSPLMDVRVRKALQKAINLDELNKAFFGGKGETMYHTHLHPTRPGWNPDWVKNFPEEYGYDPAKAKALLAEAGYTAAKPLSTNLHVLNLSAYPGTPDLIESVGNYWRQIGVDVKLVQMDPTQLAAARRELKLSNDFLVAATSSVEFIGVSAYWTSIAPRGGSEDPVVDGLFIKLRSELDAQKREAMWRQLGDESYKKHMSINLLWLPAEATFNPQFVADSPWPGNISGTWTHVEYIKATPK